MEKIKACKKVYMMVTKTEEDFLRIDKRCCIQFGYIAFTDIMSDEQIVADFLKATNMVLDKDQKMKVVGILSNAIQIALIDD